MSVSVCPPAYLRNHVSTQPNESVPKITMNHTINLFFYTALSILIISNRNSSRLLFDKEKLRPYILFEKIHLHFSVEHGQPSKPALCQLYRHTFVPYVTRIPAARSYFGDAVIRYAMHFRFCRDDVMFPAVTGGQAQATLLRVTQQGAAPVRGRSRS